MAILEAYKRLSKASTHTPADFHLHTTSSDGDLTPTQIVKLTAKAGKKAIAITDHDTVNGVDEAITAAKKLSTQGQPIQVLPGIELTVFDGEKKKHLTAIINHKNKELLEYLEKIQEERKNRGKQIAEKLKQLGFKLTFQETKATLEKNSVSRKHFANLLENGIHAEHNKNLFKEMFSKDLNSANIFDELLENGKPAHVAWKQKISLKNAISLLKNAGAKDIAWAHPAEHEIPSLEELKKFKKLGGTSIEVFVPAHSEKQKTALQKLAEKAGLGIVIGGTDFHGKQSRHL